MRLVSRVPCLIGLGFGAAIAAPTGYTYTVRVSTDHGQTLIAHAWAKGDKLRVKLESGERDEGAMRRVSYVLGQDGGRTLFFVDSVDRIYFPFGTGPGRKLVVVEVLWAVIPRGLRRRCRGRRAGRGPGTGTLGRGTAAATVPARAAPRSSG